MQDKKYLGSRISQPKIEKKLNKLKSVAENISSIRKTKKILEETEKFSKDIDVSIKSIAESTFIRNKVSKLKELGSSKLELEELIGYLNDKEEELSENSLKNKIKSKIKYFFIDKNFDGLSVDQIIKKVNVQNTKTSQYEETNLKVQENSKLQSKEIKNSKDNNKKIHEYLKNTKDTEAAKFIEHIIDKDYSTNKVSNIEQNTKEIISLSTINKKIYEKLTKIEENMIDEQDTSIQDSRSIKSEVDKAMRESLLNQSYVQNKNNGKNSGKNGKDQNSEKGFGLFGILAGAGSGYAAKKLMDWYKKKPSGVVDDLKESKKLSKIKPARTASAASTFGKKAFKYSRYLGKGLGIAGAAYDFFNPDEFGVGIGEEDLLIYDYIVQTDLKKKLYMAEYALKYTQDTEKQILIKQDIQLIKDQIKVEEDLEKLRELRELQGHRMDPEQKADIERRIKILERRRFQTPLIENRSFQDFKSRWSSSSTGYYRPINQINQGGWTTPIGQRGNYIDSKFGVSSERLEQFKNMNQLRSQNYVQSKESKDNTQEAMRFFINHGFSKEQAAGIVGNLMAESPKLNPYQREFGNGPGYGIAQWTSKDRILNFEKVMGKSLYESNLDDQLNFVLWELQNVPGFGLSKLLDTSTASDAALVFMSKYERPGKPHTENRISNAEKLVNSEIKQPDTNKISNAPEPPELLKMPKMQEVQQTETNLIKNTIDYDKNTKAQSPQNNQQNISINTINNKQEEENSAFNIFAGS